MKVLALFVSFVVIAYAQTKPQWPVEFDCPFGLYVPQNGTTAGVVNSTSHFYYNFNIESSVIDYPTNCIPLGFEGSDQVPCRFYFNPKGTYLYFPEPPVGFPSCALAFPGVGSVPPDFLAGFSYVLPSIALDFYGVSHFTNMWAGTTDQGFQYWTDATTGHDVAFLDGGSVLWTFGRFNVQNQKPTIFQLPEGCNNTMDFRLEDVRDPLLQLSASFMN